MKIKSLFIGLLAAVVSFSACQDEEQNLGTPDISISDTELTFGVEGGEQVITVTASRDWKVETDADWVGVSPESGAGSTSAQNVTVTVLENTGMDREAELKFTIGMKSKYLTVSQAGPGGSVESLVVYANNFDKTKAEKTGSGDNASWKTYLDDASYDGWRNETGSGIETVTYAAKSLTARTNSANGSGGQHSFYVDLGASGMNYLWFGTAPTYFAIKNITLPEGKKDYTLSFGSERYKYGADDNTYNWDEFGVYISADAKKWVKLSFDFAGGTLPNGKWDLASSTFTLPEGTTALNIYFTSSESSAYAIDDVKLVQSDKAGTAIDFASGEEFEVGGNIGGGSDTPVSGKPESLTKATIAEFLAAEESTSVWYELTGEIISIAKADYGNFTIKDATGEVYIYGMTSKWVGSNDKSFSQIGLKVGDKVTLGTLRGSYQGTPQGGGNPVPAYYISHVPGEGGSDNPGTGETPNPPAGDDDEVTGTVLTISRETMDVEWTTNGYGQQNISNLLTYLSWSVNGVGFIGAKMCLPPSNNSFASVAIQCQGNASDTAKQSRFGNTESLGKIKKITVVSHNESYTPNFNLAVGTEQVVGVAVPSSMIAASSMTTTKDGTTYTSVYVPTEDVGFFAIYKNTQGAFYFSEVIVEYEAE